MADYSEAKIAYDKAVAIDRAVREILDSGVKNKVAEKLRMSNLPRRVLVVVSDDYNFTGSAGIFTTKNAKVKAGQAAMEEEAVINFLESYRPEIIITPHIIGSLTKTLVNWVKAYGGSEIRFTGRIPFGVNGGQFADNIIENQRNYPTIFTPMDTTGEGRIKDTANLIIDISKFQRNPASPVLNPEFIITAVKFTRVLHKATWLWWWGIGSSSKVGNRLLSKIAYTPLVNENIYQIGWVNKLSGQPAYIGRTQHKHKLELRDAPTGKYADGWWNDDSTELK